MDEQLQFLRGEETEVVRLRRQLSEAQDELAQYKQAAQAIFDDPILYMENKSVMWKNRAKELQAELTLQKEWYESERRIRLLMEEQLAAEREAHEKTKAELAEANRRHESQIDDERNKHLQTIVELGIVESDLAFLRAELFSMACSSHPEQRPKALYCCMCGKPMAQVGDEPVKTCNELKTELVNAQSRKEGLIIEVTEWQETSHQMRERAEKAEAELAELRVNLSLWKTRAKSAESSVVATVIERDELKARIERAPKIVWGMTIGFTGVPPYTYRSDENPMNLEPGEKVTVALVPVEKEESK